MLQYLCGPSFALRSQEVNMPNSERVQYFKKGFGDNEDVDDHWKDRTNTSSPDEVEDGFVVISDEATAEWVRQFLFLIHQRCRYLAADNYQGRRPNPICPPHALPVRRSERKTSLWPWAFVPPEHHRQSSFGRRPGRRGGTSDCLSPEAEAIKYHGYHRLEAAEERIRSRIIGP